MFVDDHIHLDAPQYDKDRDEVIARAKSAKVKAIIANGTNPESNRNVLALSEKYDVVQAALGAYPLDILGFGPNGEKQKPFDLTKELEFMQENKSKFVAIGEVGLDGYHVPESLKDQKPHFQNIVDLAEKIRKPLIVHSRKAERETIEMLESSKAKVVMHCFGGSKKLVSRCIENKWMFSIPTSIVRSQHFQMIASLAPNKQILTETDGPWQSAQKETRNEPAFIVEAVKKIAELKELTVEDTAQLIFQNYQRVY